MVEYVRKGCAGRKFEALGQREYFGETSIQVYRTGSFNDSDTGIPEAPNGSEVCAVSTDEAGGAWHPGRYSRAKEG